MFRAGSRAWLGSERDTCTPMFIIALFIIARTWKQPRCPSADEQIRKLWYIYTVEYYSAIKKNTFESVLMRWMKLEPIIQSEVSQKDKDHYNILMHIYGILKDGNEKKKDGNDNPICRTEKETPMYRTDFGLCGRRWGWDGLREYRWNMHIIKCETDHQPRLDAWDKCSGLVHWEHPEGWDGEYI